MAASPGDGFELVFSKDRIQERVRALADRIQEDFSEGGELVVVGVLKGAFLFLADLVRELDLPCRVEFLWISSYGDRRESAGEIRVRKDLELSIQDRDVLLVEDVADSGLSLRFLHKHLTRRGPRRLAIAVLVDKREENAADPALDYVGFRAGREFLVGYGMDDAGRFRNLPDIYRVQT